MPRNSGQNQRKTKGLDIRYPIGYNGGMTGNNTNTKGAAMSSEWMETVTDYVNGKNVPVVWFHSDYPSVRIRFDMNCKHPKPFFVSSSNSVLPTARFATIEDAKRAVTVGA